MHKDGRHAAGPAVIEAQGTDTLESHLCASFS
jgi:hypothetical protein